MDLLTRTRKINEMLQKTSGQHVNFREMAMTLREAIGSNVFVASRCGKLRGFSLEEEIDTDGLFKIEDTSANIDVDSEYTAFPVENRDIFKNGLTTIVPIKGGGQRLGTLILSRLNRSFSDDDLILAEYGATVVGMEILHEK